MRLNHLEQLEGQADDSSLHRVDQELRQSLNQVKGDGPGLVDVVAGLGLGALLVDDVDAAQQEATLPHTAMGLLVKMCRRVARTGAEVRRSGL